MRLGSWRILLSGVLLLLGGCSAAPVVKDYTALDPKAEREFIYIVPFDATLVPPDFGDPIFNQFVDMLNSRRKQTKVGRFVILKEELKDVEAAWLIKQVYISGDIWGYVEKSGCCSTELKIKSRIFMNEPGKNGPTFEVYAPAEHYFEHDRSDMVSSRVSLGKKLAQELAEAVIKKLTP